MSGDNENLLSSVKFYALNNHGNLHELYESDEWKFKTLAFLIRKKGWEVIFEGTSIEIPTEAEATAADATDEVKALYKANSEAYDQILMADDGKKEKNVAINVERQGQGPQGKKHYKKPFKGHCRKCGKQGHKASECKSDKKGVCTQCGEDRHFARNCPKKGGQGANSGTVMFVGMTDGNVQEFLMDSGASCHVIGSGNMLIYPGTSRETIKVGDGTVMKATKQGTLLIQAENGARIKLTRVQMVPGIVKNIISTGCLATQGNSVIMEGNDPSEGY